MMGLEPTTFCMASRRSSQLSYIRTRAEYSRGFSGLQRIQGLVDEPVR
jgi:hypothetical protein